MSRRSFYLGLIGLFVAGAALFVVMQREVDEYEDVDTGSSKQDSQAQTSSPAAPRSTSKERLNPAVVLRPRSFSIKYGGQTEEEHAFSVENEVFREEGDRVMNQKFLLAKKLQHESLMLPEEDFPLLEEMINEFDKVSGGFRYREREPKLFLNMLRSYQMMIVHKRVKPNIDSERYQKLVRVAVSDTIAYERRKLFKELR